MYFLAEEKNNVQTAWNIDLNPRKLKQNIYWALGVFKCPKFQFVPLAASSAEFWNCTLQFVLIGGKCRPDVKDNYNCLMKIACF